MTKECEKHLIQLNELNNAIMNTRSYEPIEASMDRVFLKTGEFSCTISNAEINPKLFEMLGFNNNFDPTWTIGFDVKEPLKKHKKKRIAKKWLKRYGTRSVTKTLPDLRMTFKSGGDEILFERSV